MLNDKFSMSRYDNILYAKRNIVDSIYSESRLEGIAVTYPDTQEIFDGRTVAGLTVEETIKVNNLKHAWHFILDNIDYPMDLRFIKQINSYVGKSVVINEGILRTADVKVGGTHWRPEIPNESNVQNNIELIVNDKNSSATEKAISLCLYIMRGQLFMDGNKRTAQIAANKIMIENGVGILCIPVEKQNEFLKLLIDFYESNAPEIITEFFYKNCIDGANLK